MCTIEPEVCMKLQYNLFFNNIWITKTLSNFQDEEKKAEQPNSESEHFDQSYLIFEQQQKEKLQKLVSINSNTINVIFS